MRLVVHYHEIALKGRNRRVFVQRLAGNLHRLLRDLGPVRVRTLYGRLVVTVENAPLPELHRRMAGAFGVANYSLVEEVPQDFEQMVQAAWRQVEQSPARTFAVRCRRADKEFPMGSLEVEREVGSRLFLAAREAGRELRVDLRAPELTVLLEIVDGLVLVSGPKHPGPGGLPVGMAGRLVGLLSSGFDSPVACWNLVKRGAEVVMCHFHSHPYTDRASLDTCRLLAERLTRFQFRTRLYLVPLAPVQERIMTLTPADWRMILYRRSMLRQACAVARREGAEALVTGESLCQVASQTLTNLAVLDQAAGLPVLRPLIGSDKAEILARAREIGTYELSARPCEDACTYMVGSHPVTRARLAEVLRLEEALDLAPLEAAAVEEAEVVDLEWPERSGRPERPARARRRGGSRGGTARGGPRKGAGCDSATPSEPGGPASGDPS